MGIAERIAQIQAATAARDLAAKQEAQRKLEEAKALQLQAQALAAKQEAERRTTIITELSPLLELVKAREQLEIVRDKIWQAGELDTEPTPILYDNEDFKKLSLGLRAKYNTVESFSGENYVSVRPSSNVVFINIEAVNNGDNGIPRIWVSSGLSNNNANYLEFAEVSLEQPQEAQDKLEEMLAEACIRLGDTSKFIRHQEEHFKSFRFGEETRPAQTPP